MMKLAAGGGEVPPQDFGDEIINPILDPSIRALSPTSFIQGLLRVGITAAFIAASIYFFFNFILGGIAWMGSGGDKTKLQEARSRVLNAIIGIVVVLSTFIIINFISAIFGVNLTTFDLSALIIAP